MKNRVLLAISSFVFVCLASWTAAAQSAAIPAAAVTATVPNVVSYSGVLKDASGRVLTGVRGVTFLLYENEQGGAPLWMETQNVTPDRTGHYTVQLGATIASGMPAGLFVNGQARWLAVQVASEAEQTRAMLVAVPYAMKAGDAATIGGLPPSAFVLAAPPATSNRPVNEATSASPAVTSNVTTSGGTVNTLPLFTTATNIQNSAVTQTGSGATAKIGINTTTPATVLDVNGGGTIRGAFSLPSTGTATAASGKNSQPELFTASAFNSSTLTAVAQKFQWQAEPVGNNTATASGTLNLLFGLGTGVPAETGLKIGHKGIITFAAGQTFPGTGPGTVKSVGLAAPASDFTVSGSPVTTTGTLTFAWKVAPTNADTANAIVKRDASGNFSAGTITAADVNLSDAIDISTSTNAFPANISSSVAGATAVLGQATATSGEGWGVEGTTSSNQTNAYGVFGFNESLGGGPGVYGLTNGGGVGVRGNFVEPSVLSATYFSGFAGVWGDGGAQADGGFAGVMGTNDSGFGGYFSSNSATDAALESVAYNTNEFPFAAYNSPNVSYCTIDQNGNLNCSGAKNAVVPVDGGARRVAMSAIEAPQNWFEDAGSGHLVNGSAVVGLDPTFMQTVNTDQEYQVFLTPYGDCKGLYVSNRTTNSFEVHELGGGTASLSFGYRIMALRRKYESVRFADHTNDPTLAKQAAERMARRMARPQVHPVLQKPMPARAASLAPAVPGRR